MKIELTFTTSLLGTVASDPAVFKEYLAKDPSEVYDLPDVVAGESEQEERPKLPPTCFYRHEGKPVLRDYQIKGFFKDAAGMLRRVPDTRSSKEKAYKKAIDGLVFVEPRYLPLELAGPMTLVSRPLRAQTAKGERIAIAYSEEAPAGTKVWFHLVLLDTRLRPWIEELLNYGHYRGLGQWRNSGQGSFNWAESS